MDGKQGFHYGRNQERRVIFHIAEACTMKNRLVLEQRGRSGIVFQASSELFNRYHKPHGVPLQERSLIEPDISICFRHWNHSHEFYERKFDIREI